jgi:3-oxoacyl-[acyl-carrier-protein] synthase-1/3-oxoacyl-[acyl-carrier-protein] synthase II
MDSGGGSPRKRAFITGLGLVTPAGVGTRRALDALRAGERHIGPLSLFEVVGRAGAYVGEVPIRDLDSSVPRPHALAAVAAAEALSSGAGKVDAIVVGATTGGISTTEVLLRDGVDDPAAYVYHGTGTVAACLAGLLGCRGPALTVSTACSSGAVALVVGLELIRQGLARRVLAGGVDALCRLTIHGFDMLRLIDPDGTRPFDEHRAGMSVGEGAAMLVLEAGDEAPPAGALAELRGGGLSCDAYHPSSPHPEGAGALAAMREALDDAGASVGAIEYVNLHGTGTVDNDASEARALVALFGAELPEHSSIKGSFGHAVGAAGALGAAASTLAVAHGFIPANVGCRRVAPEMGLTPTLEPHPSTVRLAMANSFGFGGNNAALVLGDPSLARSGDVPRGVRAFEVLGVSCVTGAGDLRASLEALRAGVSLAGVLPDEEMTRSLPRQKLRRLKRLTRMALSLTATAATGRDGPLRIGSVFYGTCWGALSELHDFLVHLFESGEEFSSPTDFVGTVHNAVGGHVALWNGARGANVTTTAGDTSFEEALFLASLLAARDEPLLVLGADEEHPVFSPRLYASHDATTPADGGGALVLRPAGRDPARTVVRCAYLGPHDASRSMDEVVAALGGADRVGSAYAGCWIDVPSAEREDGEARRRSFVELSGFRGPCWDVRSVLGQFPTVSAAATALSVAVVESGEAPAVCAGATGPLSLDGRGLLLLSLGRRVAAIEVLPPSPTCAR